jgi:hypothetical protein
MLTKLERQERWLEERKKIMATRHELTQVALAEGVEPPQWEPLPLTMPREFLKPATVVKRHVRDPLVAGLANDAPILSPEQQFQADQQTALGKATDKARRVIASQQPRRVGSISAKRPKIREEVLEIASTNAALPAARRVHEQPRPNERVEDFLARVQGEHDDR